MQGRTHSDAGKRHLLTVAVEDYFQATALQRSVPASSWRRLESRVEVNTRRALELLARHEVHGTFFVLGWVAERMPEVVAQIASAGHEVASKGFLHRTAQEMSREEFRDDLLRAREVLERASGREVIGHRVAQGTLRLEDLWVLDLLAEEGYRYDSSIYPRFRSIAAEPWRRFPHAHDHAGHRLMEFPLSTWGTDALLLPMAGGNYFRQIPEVLLRRAFAHWHERYTSPFNMYFHVWELDPDLPRITNTGLLARIRQYRNLGKLPKVIDHFLSQYRFSSIADFLGVVPAVAEREGPGEQTALASSSTLRLSPQSLPTDEPPASERPAVTVVVPLFDEECTLTYLANSLAEMDQTLGRRYDLRYVMVDDASRDATWPRLEEVFGSDPRVKRVRHEQNQGVAAAILTGIRHAETELVCSMDCDCSYDPEQFQEMIPMLTDGVAMVTASPYHERGAVVGVPGWRLFLSKSLSRLYRRVLHCQLSTYTSCFRVYRRSAVVDLALEHGGFLGVAELLARLDRRGEKIVECPAVLRSRLLGASKMKTLMTVAGHLWLLCDLTFHRRERTT